MQMAENDKRSPLLGVEVIGGLPKSNQQSGLKNPVKNNSPDEIMSSQINNYFQINVDQDKRRYQNARSSSAEIDDDICASPSGDFAGFSDRVGFYRDKEGYLMCEGLRISDVAHGMPAEQSPFYLMSKGQLNENFNQYKNALKGLDSAFIGYAVKANHNLNLLKHLAGLGSGAVVVSGNELQMALHAGFKPSQIVFNGNGKTLRELTFAVKEGVIVNVDSEFDLEHIIQAAKANENKARVILRINPDIDPQVHPYVSTGLASSKFGIQNKLIPQYLQRIKEQEKHIQLIGVQCHIGQTIELVQVVRDATLLLVDFVKQIRSQGFDLEYLDIGGGLGIDYAHDEKASIPTPMDLIDSIRDLVEQMNLKLIIEPGRSLVGNTCVLVNRVTGVKSNGHKNFIVIDGSMCELIRPSLYGAYHHIELAEPHRGGEEFETYDVVGPVCESEDFLGKDRKLQKPNEGDCLVVYDAGAYCQAMSSVYNLRLTCPEYWVEGAQIQQIRKPLTLETYMENFDCQIVSTTDQDKHSIMAAKASKNILSNNNNKNETFSRNSRSICSESRDRASLQMNTSINNRSLVPTNNQLVRKSNIELESYPIDQIDEDDEDQYISPERPARENSFENPSLEHEIDNHLKLEIDEGRPLKLRNLSSNRANKDSVSCQNESEKSFYFSSDLTNKKSERDYKYQYEKSQESKDSSVPHGSESRDSEDQDLLFALKQEQERDLENQQEQFNTDHLDDDSGGQRNQVGLQRFKTETEQSGRAENKKIQEKAPSQSKDIDNLLQDENDTGEPAEPDDTNPLVLEEIILKKRMTMNEASRGEMPQGAQQLIELEDCQSPLLRIQARNYRMNEELKIGDCPETPLRQNPQQDDQRETSQTQIKEKIPLILPSNLQESITEIKQADQCKTAKKLQSNLISPIKFMSQRKMPMPFKIREMAYHDSNDEDDGELNLCKNDGGEIDIKQLTSSKKQRPQQERPHLLLNNPALAGVRTQGIDSSATKHPSSSVDRMNLLGLRQSQTSKKLLPQPNDFKTTTSQVQDRNVNLAEGIKGLGSAGIRLSGGGFGRGSGKGLAATRLQNSCAKAPQSSTSSRKDAFRNRLKLSESLSNYGAFNRFKGIRDGDAESSVSSRFVIKLDGNNFDTDILSQQEQEQMFQNDFEQQYEELEVLGEGCSSVVKKCEHKILKQTRAVKIIRSDDDEYIEISKREYKLLKELNFPSIVKMYDCIHDENKGSLYLIMEYIAGETLEDFVLKHASRSSRTSPAKKQNSAINQQAQNNKQPKPTNLIKEELIRKVIKQLVQAIDYLHCNGVCHRDLKPDNVLLNLRTKQIKLMDFNASKRFMECNTGEEQVEEMEDKVAKGDLNGGISKDVRARRRVCMRTVTGLDQWSAPETRQGSDYSEQVDMWGVGCIMYYMMARQPPFFDYDEPRLREKVQKCECESMPQRCIDYYSKDCLDLVKQLIIADPQKRLTAKQALQTNWLSKEEKIGSQDSPPIEQIPYISPRKGSLGNLTITKRTETQNENPKPISDIQMPQKNKSNSDTALVPHNNDAATHLNQQASEEIEIGLGDSVPASQADPFASPEPGQKSKCLRDRAIPPSTRIQRRNSPLNALNDQGQIQSTIASGSQQQLQSQPMADSPRKSQVYLDKFSGQVEKADQQFAKENKCNHANQLIGAGIVTNTQNQSRGNLLANALSPKGGEQEQSGIIRLQQIRMAGGYSSDDDEDEQVDSINQFLRNQNANYFKSKNQLHTKRRHPDRRHDLKIPQQDKSKRDSHNFVNIESGYEHGVESSGPLNIQDLVHINKSNRARKKDAGIGANRTTTKKVNSKGPQIPIRKSKSQTNKQSRVPKKALDLKIKMKHGKHHGANTNAKEASSYFKKFIEQEIEIGHKRVDPSP